MPGQHRKVGSEDPTIAIPVVSANDVTQEIQRDTQELPVLDNTVPQPVITEPLPYIVPTSRGEREHEGGTRPGNGLMGTALSLVVGIIVGLIYLDNITIDTSKEDEPRPKQSQSTSAHPGTPRASVRPSWEPTTRPPETANPETPVWTKVAPQGTPSSATTTPPQTTLPPAQPSASPSFEPKPPQTPTISPTAEPTTTDEALPTTEPTGQSTSAPEQSGAPTTAITP